MVLGRVLGFAGNVLMVLVSMAGQCTSANPCRCVPDQWQGIMSSVEREYHGRMSQSTMELNTVEVTYDYIKKIFIMYNKNLGYKAIADYKKGYKYVVTEDSCTGLKTPEKMRRMCVPANAKLLNEFLLAGNVPVTTWIFSGPFNITIRSTLEADNCIPVLDEVYMDNDDKLMSTNSVYMNVTLGVPENSDDALIKDCVIANEMKKRRSQWNPKNTLKLKRLLGQLVDQPILF